MANTKPCNECKHYDVILKGDQRGGFKETQHAWCAKYSVYPYTEAAGQKFPEGVARVESPEMLAKPRIVRRGEVKINCPSFEQKEMAMSKADLLRKMGVK